MSWSVSACGPAAKAAEQLEQQFSKITMNDKGEQETVQNTRLLVSQTLAAIDPDKPVNVTASGSMGYANWGTHEKPYQSVDVKIAPIHFSV
jgi:hypothetical protein